MTIKYLENEINYMMNSKIMYRHPLQYKFANIDNKTKAFTDLVNLYKLVKYNFDERCNLMNKNFSQRI